MSIDPVERRLEQSFEAERWTRFIQDCQDLEQLRETALALVQQLAQQKAASAWMATRASESENAKLEMLARMIRQQPDGEEEQATESPGGSPSRRPGRVSVFLLPAAQVCWRELVAVFGPNLDHAGIVLAAALHLIADRVVALLSLIHI